MPQTDSIRPHRAYLGPQIFILTDKIVRAEQLDLI